MPANDVAPTVATEDLSIELKDSLKNCQAMVRDYRATLGIATDPEIDVKDSESPLDPPSPSG